MSNKIIENVYLAIVKENITGALVNVSAHSSKESAERGLSIMKHQYGNVEGEILCKKVYSFTGK